MRIVHAVRSDAFAGVERHVAHLARAQAAGGDRVVVIGGAPGRMRSTIAHRAVRLQPAATTADVVRELRPLAPRADVVHVHMTAAEVAATLAGLGRRIGPVVSTRHFGATRGSGPLGPLAAAVARHRVEAQIAISRYVADRVDGPSIVVHPGVDSRPDGPRAAERERSVLMVQRLEPEKGTDEGLRIFAASGLADAGWTLDIAGHGSQREALGLLAADLGLGGAIRFLGARDDVDQLLSSAGILLAPCPVEGLGLSVLEAMASTLPVVAADAGGHRETVGLLDAGVLFDVGDDRGAGKLLADLAADHAARDAIGRAGAALQRSSFTPEAQAQATTTVYATVLR